MGYDINSGENSVVKGYVIIEKENKKTGVREIVQNNTVTDLGKMLFLATSANLQLLSPSQIGRGQLFLQSGLVKKSSQSNDKLQVDNVDKALTMYLVNSAEGLSASSRLLPVYDVTGKLDPNKVVGHASFRRTPLSPKEGVIDRIKDEYMVDKLSIVQRWKFDNSQANGKPFNKICIGAGVHATDDNGFLIAKGIDGSDVSVLGGSDTLSTDYMRPGVTGFTAPNEVLVSIGRSTAKANAVFNLESGALTMLSPTDNRYDVPLGIARSQQVFHNGHLYFVDKTNNVVRFKVADKTVTTIGQSLYGCLFREKTANIVRWGNENEVLLGYNMDTLANATSLTLTNQGITTNHWWSTFYTEFMKNSVIGNDADGNYVIARIDPNVQNYGPKKNYIFTDITNIVGSIIGIRNENMRFANEYTIPTATGSKVVNICGSMQNDLAYTGVTGLSPDNAGRANNSIKFSEQWFGNLVSFVELQSPITKTADDVLYVSYGYKFV